ncbi:MAG: tetratricopeptide repeat protein [Ancrocorticia sp.]|jgi:putative thioredoxin|nr:tetratricopeptide repeat protein [Ancrocorticia sp.]MCI1895986.1 tetratricopeptide repeat protein [Ancrocorticia sp.]MCI1932450.1 tetratricopeptide repeat protein [Ancrocorticia sp.]MCI1964138.1 tetratricopeptide repeat protein [Ancrocorticia sp.]MCI2002575.1 tetratricopeptide repeat protein [Ancrocorticia sp.]
MMTQSLNSMYGAVDLSGLAGSADATAKPAAESKKVPGPFVLDVSAANLKGVLENSKNVPVIAGFYSNASDQSLAVDTQLRALAKKYEGRFQLARINTDVSADVAQAFGVSGVPAGVAVLQGQPIPLYQGVPAEGQLAPLVEKILQAAAQYGITGVMDGTESQEPAEPQLPPHMKEAYDALDKGDYATAHQEFKEALRQNPGLDAAKVGLHQVKLVERLSHEDRNAVLAQAKVAPLTDIETHMRAADIEVALGHPDAGFSRLIDVIKATEGKERETVRERLLELFDAVGPHEAIVTQARRKLSAALF